MGGTLTGLCSGCSPQGWPSIIQACSSQSSSQSPCLRSCGMSPYHASRSTLVESSDQAALLPVDLISDVGELNPAISNLDLIELGRDLGTSHFCSPNEARKRLKRIKSVLHDEVSATPRFCHNGHLTLVWFDWSNCLSKLALAARSSADSTSAPIFVGTVVDPHQQQRQEQALHHRNAAPQRRAVQFAAVSRRGRGGLRVCDRPTTYPPLCGKP